MEKKQYDPLEIKDGYLPRIWNWCKKRIKAIITIGSIGLVLSGIQTYKVLFSPDIAEQINGTIISTIEEFKAIDKVIVPDSLLKTNKEVQLLKLYQDEFELFTLYLMGLDYSEINSDDDVLKLAVYRSRLNANMEYGNECNKMINLVTTIYQYEIDSIGNSAFVNLMNVNLMKTVLEEQTVSNDERAKVIKALQRLNASGVGDVKQLSEKDKTRLYKMLDTAVGSESYLRLIQSQNRFYKSFYVATIIRLKQIINGDSKY